MISLDHSKLSKIQNQLWTCWAPQYAFIGWAELFESWPMMKVGKVYKNMKLNDNTWKSNPIQLYWSALPSIDSYIVIISLTFWSQLAKAWGSHLTSLEKKERNEVRVATESNGKERKKGKD